MFKRICKICSLMFDSVSHNTQICSSECKDIATRGSRQEYNRKKSGGRKQRKLYDEKYPLKSVAHRTVYWAIKSGKLTREPCCFCSKNKTEAHHEDYTKPLEVVWMCRPCHRLYHRMVGNF